MPTTGNIVKFSCITENEYKALSTRDTDTVYFLSDIGVVIVGGQNYTNPATTWKYIGHFDSINSTVPQSYLTYDGLDKTNYACTVGADDKHLLYVLDTSVEYPRWVKVSNSVITSLEQTIETITQTAQNDYTLYTLIGRFGDFWELESIHNSGRGPYYLSNIPDEKSIVIEATELGLSYFDFTYDSSSNSITLTQDPISSGGNIQIRYLRKFNLYNSTRGGTLLDPHLFYYSTNESIEGDLKGKIYFSEPLASDIEIHVYYFDMSDEGQADILVGDGETSEFTLSHSIIPSYPPVDPSINITTITNIAMEMSSGGESPYSIIYGINQGSLGEVFCFSVVYSGQYHIDYITSHIDDQHVPSAKAVVDYVGDSTFFKVGQETTRDTSLLVAEDPNVSWAHCAGYVDVPGATLHFTLPLPEVLTSNQLFKFKTAHVELRFANDSDAADILIYPVDDTDPGHVNKVHKQNTLYLDIAISDFSDFDNITISDQGHHNEPCTVVIGYTYQILSR